MENKIREMRNVHRHLKGKIVSDLCDYRSQKILEAHLRTALEGKNIPLKNRC